MRAFIIEIRCIFEWAQLRSLWMITIVEILLSLFATHNVIIHWANSESTWNETAAATEEY